MKRLNTLTLIAWATGFGLMTYELAAARVLAPSIGSSTYVWTSVIGVIIAALSVGYYAGGRMADARGRTSDVVWLLMLAAGAVVVTRLSYVAVLDWTVDLTDDPRWQGSIASLVLFAPASFTLGMISPYLVKLNTRALDHAGRSVASLSTWNAIGSIAGTFVTGFILFGLIGAQATFVIVVALLVGVSWLLAPRSDVLLRSVVSLVVIGLACMPVGATTQTVSIDTPSSQYQIVHGYYEGRALTGLQMGAHGLQSGIFDDKPSQLAFWYTQEMARLTLDAQPQRVLMLGGGAFTLPRYVAEQLPETQIDVVEIDPALRPIAEQYFAYDNPANVQLIFQDARTFLNTNTTQYDVVLVDVYGETSIPFTLMTREYAALLARATTDDGRVIANIIGNVWRGDACQESVAALDAAYRSQFAYAWYSNDDSSSARTNHVLRYQRQDAATEGQTVLPDLHGRLYSDNFAPAERLHFRCMQTD